METTFLKTWILLAKSCGMPTIPKVAIGASKDFSKQVYEINFLFFHQGDCLCLRHYSIQLHFPAVSFHTIMFLENIEWKAKNEDFLLPYTYACSHIETKPKVQESVIWKKHTQSINVALPWKKRAIMSIEFCQLLAGSIKKSQFILVWNKKLTPIHKWIPSIKHFFF